GLAELLTVALDPPVGRLERRRIQRAGYKRLVQLVVARVLRQRLGEVDPVAVQVHSLFRDPPQPGEAVGIDRMGDQHGNAIGELAATVLDPVALAGRTGEALDAVGRRDHHQDLAGIARPEPGDAGRQLLAARPATGAGAAH